MHVSIRCFRMNKKIVEVLVYGDSLMRQRHYTVSIMLTCYNKSQ